MLTDRVLAKALASGGDDPRSEIERALTLAVRRGTFLKGSVGRDDERDEVYTLNTESDRKALAEMVGAEPPPEAPSAAEPWEDGAQRPNVFGLYEDNVGMLSPMIAEELKEAEELYPQSWIEDAFKEAVGHNKRSWRYIAAILERWQQEGRDDGEPVRGPKKSRYY